MSWRVLIPDAVHSVCDEVLTAAGCSVTRMEKPDTDELNRVVGEYDAIIVRSAIKVTAETISHMNGMVVIGRAGAGVDNIDLGAAAAAGIQVRNTPGGNTISAAEHTVALLLSMLRHVPAADRSMKEGRWDRKLFSGTELYEKCVGVVGLGKIGREVLVRLQAFGVSVLGYDPLLSQEEIEELGATPTSLADLFQQAEIITLHVPLNRETRGMVDADAIASMVDGVYIVNASRGGVVDESALSAGLSSGKVAGAALDVYSSEPPDWNSPLFSSPNLVATPHIAATTSEAQKRVALQIAHYVLEELKRATQSVRG